MDLNNVTVEMRPRSEWEAVDFGARLVRRDARAIYRVWFAVTLPMLSLAILASLYTPYATLAVFFYWWFEPVTDAPILRIISRRLFGGDADVGSALRAMPYLLRRNWIFLLPPYRFHMARSTAIPVTQLEGLHGAQRRARAKVLNMKISNHGMGVTLAYHHLALALYLGVYLIGFALVPTVYLEEAGYSWLEMLWLDDNRWASVIGLLLMYAAQSAMHPWFVGAGFGLYINCRTQLEAWDIEVAFRRLVQRRQAGTVAAALAVCLLALPVSDALAAQGPDADESADTPDEAGYDPGFDGYWSDEEADEALARALAEEALQRYRTVEEWQKIGDEEPGPRTGDDSALYDALKRLGLMISYLAEFALWLVLLAALLLAFATREYWLPYLQDAGPRRRLPKRVLLSGGELRAESLPADIPAAVRELWNAGKPREALSLLYRGSVFAAVVQLGVRLPPGATEGLCMEALRQQAEPPESEFFRKVVRVWSACAYGFSTPPDDAVLSLCGEWPRHFGAAE